MFTKTRHNRVFEDVIEQVEDAIIRGDLRPGDRLPAERDLQKMLDVGRGTLRESLRVLEQKGLIEIKTGAKGGIFVKKMSSRQVSESLAFLLRSQQISLGHMSQFREDLEGLIAARAAVKATGEDLEELRGLLEHAGECLKDGVARWDEFMEADMNIHLALAGIADNPIHSFFLETIHINAHKYNINVYLPRKERLLISCFQDLTDLIDAVAEGRADDARDLTKRHISRFTNYMQTELPAD